MISFGEWSPELLPEWSKKNGVDPFDISYGSNKKVWWKGSCGHEWEATVKNRSNGHGCPYCSGNKVLKGFNDLPTHYSELVKEWSELNGSKRPADFTKRSTHYAWWKCPECGYQWKARIADRAEGHGCPVCAGEKLVPEINSLTAVKPELAEEWSPKNPGSPDTVFPRSRKMAWWICKRCGFEWKAVINSRFKGQRCPVCADRKVKDDFNSLFFMEPDLVKEWDYEANGDLRPSMVRASSMRPVFWKDEKGHTWRAKISDRRLGAGCPICERERQNALPLEMIRYYSAKAGLYCRLSDDSQIGVPLQVFYPEQSSAIEISTGNHMQSLKWERAVNWLCLNSGIRLIRILRPRDQEYDNCICITREDESCEALNLAVSTAFFILGATVDVDMERDEAFIIIK